MHHFHTSGLDCEQMVQWFLIDWSFVLEDGSSLCSTFSKVTCLMSAADEYVWLVLLCWLPVLGHREVADVLDAVPEGRYLEGVTCLSLGFRVSFSLYTWAWSLRLCILFYRKTGLAACVLELCYK